MDRSSRGPTGLIADLLTTLNTAGVLLFLKTLRSFLKSLWVERLLGTEAACLA